MKGFIYKITDKVNGMVYIGQTRYTVEFRWRQHLNRKDGTLMHNRMQKYGKERFTVETLEECPVHSLDEREMFYISKYDSFNSGYNLTIGGEGKKDLVLDDKYDEIKSLYLSGFSTNKIGTLFNIDKATVKKILNSLGVKLRPTKTFKLNAEERLELIEKYHTGYSLKALGKEYDVAPGTIKEYLIRYNVDLRDKYSIMEDEEGQDNMINDYLNSEIHLRDILKKYKCTFHTFKRILSIKGISLGNKKHFKMSDGECLECIRLYTQGSTIKELAKRFEVDKCTIRSMLKRYNVYK